MNFGAGYDGIYSVRRWHFFLVLVVDGGEDGLISDGGCCDLSEDSFLEIRHSYEEKSTSTFVCNYMFFVFVTRTYI